MNQSFHSDALSPRNESRYDAAFIQGNSGMQAAAQQEHRGGRAQVLLPGLLLLVLLLVMPAGAVADIDVNVRGLDSKLRDNVTAYIGKLTAEDMKTWRATHARLENDVRDAMRSQGYYDAKYQIEHREKDVVVTIQPGEPVRVQKLNLQLLGEAGNDIAFTALRENMALRTGDVFHHGNYETLKSTVQNLGLDRGYFDAEWITHTVALDPAAHTADIELVYDSGARYQFASVHFTDAQGLDQALLQPELMQRFLPFAEGDPYEASAVLKLNKALLDSRYFSEVRVNVQRDKAEGHALPVNVTLAQDRPNNIDLGIGYSTDVQQRITIKGQRPLLNTRGHGIEAAAELSPVRSRFDTKYTVPLTHPLDDTLQYFYGVQREEVEDVVNWNTVLGLQRQIKRESGWKRTYSLRWNRDTTESPYEDQVKKDLVLPGISLDRTRSKGGIDPFWGDRQFYQMEIASEEVLSDVSLVSLRGGLRYLRTLAKKHQFLLRGDAGTIVTASFDNVPQSLRFFAGGDQSLRGYAYKSVSPRDGNGVAVGARHLLTGSAEYDYEFIPRWRAAVFTDGGSAFDAFSEPFKIGSGVGIRWVSPVGPIRLDFAWAISEPGKPFRLHFSMGPNL